MAGDNALWEKVEKLKQVEVTPKQISKPEMSDTTTPRYRDTTRPERMVVKSNSTQETISPERVEAIRKSVRQLGKEAATHRCTADEKRALIDVAYQLGREGYRTSENEITRIGINWLIQDYHEKGKQSMLVRVIEALNS